MIPAITEVNFPSYATLHQATVSLQEMGDRSISTQVRINGSVVPDFTGWELQFKGERFILPTKTPQAQKDNTTKNALVDLQFQSWAIEQLKSYFFVSLSEYETGKFIPDQYNASVILPFESFVQLFNKVLQYYFGTSIRMDLFGAGQGIYSTTPVTVEINKTYIWDVLIKFYELFGVRWYIEYEQATGAYVIKVGYAADAITDHDFEYGYQGGLLKFERHVQDADVRNILIGRGGEKNLPYRYFKLQDPNNTAWEADPDAIPELANIYFDRLRDINFRWYVRGWMQNSHRDTSWDSTHTFPQYTENDCPESHLFAFRKGKTDATFEPVEYVKDDDSITKYGERWGAVDDNDEVYPTIQGMTRSGLGRVDECVAVSDIVTDDIDAAAETASTTSPIGGTKIITKTVPANSSVTDELLSEPFTIPSTQTGNVEYSWMNPRNKDSQDLRPDINLDATITNLVAVDENTGTEYPIDGLQAGTYRIKITLKAVNSTSSAIQATYGLDTLNLVLSAVNENAWKPTFDIWVKNIWGTEFQDEEHPTETAAQYATRVWEKILGDRAGNEAKLVFSDGFMSTSQDYEFVIAAYPVYDTSKSINGVQSEWKITLYKSDAEFEATGLFIPNSTTGGKPSAGDHFFFIGIDMPFLYVEAAEERLNGADLTPTVNKTAALEDLSEVQPTWVITLDKVRVNTLEAGEYGQTLAERLSAGATVRIKDPRFTPGQTLTLYVKSITYTWNEPTSGNPYLVPDIEVVLSDTVAAVEGTVTRVANELNVVKATYAKSSDVEAAVRSVGNALFLKKTGEADTSNSPTTFASKVASKSFRQGDIGGAGWGFYEEDPAKVQVQTRAASNDTEEKGSSVLEIDKLIVRKELHVNELVANQISYVGGKKITSAAAIECTQVIEDSSFYYCYFDQKQGTVANLFQVGDFAMGQDFDEENVEVRYYKMQVAEAGANYIKLSKSVKDGSGAPEVGDTIVQYGNATVEARQFVIVEDVIGGGYIRMISGLSTVGSSGDEYVFLGRQNNTQGSNSGSGAGTGSGPRAFVGDHDGEYVEWANGVLNIKGRFSVRKSDGTYQSMASYIDDNDVAYLKAATNDGATLVDGGLILTNLIALGQTVSDQFQINAGINGIMNAERTRLGGGVAAWFGGIPSDKDDLDTGVSAYAKSLFRFDGSGYLAGGNIHWDETGHGGIPGITWSRPAGAQNDVITISAGVMLEQTGGTDSTVTDLLTAVQSVTGMFQSVAYTVNGQTRHYIKVNAANYDGIAAEGFGNFASSAGFTPGGGGGGVDLNAVWASLQNTQADTHASDKFHKNHLPAIVQSDGISAAYTLDSGNLVTQLNIGISSIDQSKVSGLSTALAGKADASALNDMATQTWVGNNYLPLSAGSSNKLTGTLFLTEGAGIEYTSAGILVYKPTNWSGISSSQWGVGAADCQGVIRSNANNLVHYRGGTNYNILDTYNFVAGTNYVAPSALDSYLPLAGGTMSNTNLVTNLNADLLDGIDSSEFARASDSSMPITNINWLGYGNLNIHSGWPLVGPAITVGATNYYSRIQFSATEDKFYFQRVNQGTGGDWREVYHSGNSNKASADWSCYRSKTREIRLFGDAYNLGTNQYYSTIKEVYEQASPNYLNPAIVFSTMNETDQAGSEVERMRIASNGNVGIGTNSPGSKLTVAGDISLYSASGDSPSLFFQRGTMGGTYTDWKVVNQSGSLNFYAYDNTMTGWSKFVTLSGDGNVGFGVAQPAYKVDVAGVINASTGVRSPGYGNFAASYSSSDQRLKDDIETIKPEYAIEKVMALRPSEWVWNEKSSLAGRKGAGLVAQHVEPVLPWNLEKSGEYLSLNYDMFHPYEIGSIQYLKRENDMLKNELKDMAAKIERLERITIKQ